MAKNRKTDAEKYRDEYLQPFNDLRKGAFQGVAAWLTRKLLDIFIS